MAIKEQKRKRKQEIQGSQVIRVVRHHKDPFGLNAWSKLLLGHHAGGLLGGHHSGLNGIRRFHGHGSHGHHGMLGSHGDYFRFGFSDCKKNIKHIIIKAVAIYLAECDTEYIIFIICH